MNQLTNYLSCWLHGGGSIAGSATLTRADDGRAHRDALHRDWNAVATDLWLAIDHFEHVYVNHPEQDRLFEVENDTAHQ